MSIAVGTKIGPYEVTGWLGAGGMGEVYRARDARLGREVAIKVIAATFAGDASRVHRFEQEARAAGQLNHPNILAVYDAGIHDGAPYIVSELLEGDSLRSRLTDGPLPSRKAIDFARQAAEGLAAAHEKGIVHRDVKPDNLFVTTDGRIKILDFGIAKLTARDDETSRDTGFATDTAAGMVVGTVGYMSPEQVRGEVVDARSDIFSVGTVLHEMLTGRPPFTRGTAVETMAAVLKDEPADPLPSTAPPALERIIARCLEKGRAARFQSARDLAFALDVLSGTQATAVPAPVTAPRRRWAVPLGVAVLLLGLLTAAAWPWVTLRTAAPVENPLADATISRFTNWPGSEIGAEISPDGRFVAFVADRNNDGELDLWISQVGTGILHNLTTDMPSLISPGAILRTFGFSGDGSELWISATGDGGGAKVMIPITPITGGRGYAFLRPGEASPSWSPDGTRTAYFKNVVGDPLYVAGRTGADPREIFAPGTGHSHNPVWSPEGDWIYFVRGSEATDDMDIWRVRPSGESPEQLTQGETRAANYLTLIDSRTVLFTARAQDGSGPWLWQLDVPSRATRRVITGPEQYIHVSASRDGRRVVATAANQSKSLWRVPLLDREADDREVAAHSVQVDRALAPRFAGGSLFFLGARGTGDGLWRVDERQQLSQVWNGVDGPLFEPPAVSRDGTRVAIVIREDGKRRLMVMSADGTGARRLAPSVDIQGALGQSAADWSPDGKSIVAGGSDERGTALFKIPVDGGGVPARLVEGPAETPVWSPDGQLILYSGPFVSGQADLLGVRPDGTPVKLPALRLRPGAYRFHPGGGVVYLELMAALDFKLFDLVTGKSRQLTRLGNHGGLRSFDIAPDGKHIVFDRSRENADVFLIDRPKSAKAP